VYKIIITFALLVFSSIATAQSDYNLPLGVTDISQKVYNLHMTIFYVCIAIGLVVFGLMFFAMIKHRKSKGVKAAQFHESTLIEIIWTVIPFFILIALAVPATQTLIEMEDNSNADITIKITGSQWKWHYEYFDHDFGFYSLLSTSPEQIANTKEKGVNYLLEVDKPLVLPINKKVRFLVTADDVIHSWWVPAFAVKQDANPGFINEAWTRINEPGVYRGQCAELCGKDHGFMPIVVEVLPEKEYQQWLDSQLSSVLLAKEKEQQDLNSGMTMEEAMTLGEQVYLSLCAACHMPSGEGIPGAFPALKNSKIALGDVKKHIDIVVNGVEKSAMQAYGQQLSLKKLAAVITYERNAWGNNTGDLVQANDVQQPANK